MADADLLYLVDVQEPGMVELGSNESVNWLLIDWDEIRRGDDTEYHRNTIHGLWPHRHITHYPVKVVILACIKRIRELEWKGIHSGTVIYRWSARGRTSKQTQRDEKSWELCPRCNDSRLTGDHVNIDGPRAIQLVSCTACHMAWTEVYLAHHRTNFTN